MKNCQYGNIFLCRTKPLPKRLKQDGFKLSQETKKTWATSASGRNGAGLKRDPASHDRPGGESPMSRSRGALRLPAVTADSPLRSVGCQLWGSPRVEGAGGDHGGALQEGAPSATAEGRQMEPGALRGRLFTGSWSTVAPQGRGLGEPTVPPTAGGARYLGRARKRLLPYFGYLPCQPEGSGALDSPGGQPKAAPRASPCELKRSGAPTGRRNRRGLCLRSGGGNSTRLRPQSVYPQNGQESPFSTHELC